MDLRSNLSKARGLGSAHEGTHHWLAQRITAIALIPLTFWFVSSVIKATGVHGLQGVVFLLSSPFNAIGMILFLGVAIYHGTLGIKVVIEDYVHCPCGKMVLEIATKFVSIISIVAVTFTILFAHISTYQNPERFGSGFWNGHHKFKCHKKNMEQPTSSEEENEENTQQPITDIEAPKE